MSVREIADITGSHRKTIYKRLRSGDLTGIRDHGKWKVDSRVLAEYLRKRELTGTATVPHYRRSRSCCVPKKAAGAFAKQQEQPGPTLTPKRVKITFESVTFKNLTVVGVVRDLSDTTPCQPADVQRTPEMLNEKLPAGLTPTENRVLQQLLLGKTNNQIASAMRISDSGAKGHVQHILRKLECPNRTAAVAKVLATKLP